MAAAIAARRYGLNVMVVDEQPMPGGQIWRSVDAAHRRDTILGAAYVDGRAVAASFRASGAIYEPETQLWQIEEGFRAYVSRDRVPKVIHADSLVLATGAQERPVPFPGWTLPGVLTVGAAQILLKSAGEIATDPVWIAASGPLPLLYASQLLRAGGRIAGYIDTTPAGQWRAALRYLPQALWSAGEIMKGLGWIAQLRASGVPIFKGVTDLEAIGDERIEEVRFRSRTGKAQSRPANVLFVHEGIVPSIHTAASLGCTMVWSDRQDCFHPIVDDWGETSSDGVFIAGDGAGIAGAKAALLRGELVGIRIAHRRGRLLSSEADHIAAPVRRKLQRELAVRPFLDALFKPRRKVFLPSENTIACRCEGVTAAEVRNLARLGRPGPNQVKSSSRCGMGPCQGRQCGYTVTRILAEAQGRSPGDVGYYHVRPPLKPVTLGELALLDQSEGAGRGPVKYLAREE